MARTTSAQKFKKLQEEQFALMQRMQEIEDNLVEAENTVKIEFADQVMKYLEIEDSAEALQYINQLPKRENSQLDTGLSDIKNDKDGYGNQAVHQNER